MDFFKNPNYDPLDSLSKRFVSGSEAMNEANKKANNFNELFKPFSALKNKPNVSASNFFNNATPRVRQGNLASSQQRLSTQNMTPLPNEMKMSRLDTKARSTSGNGSRIEIDAGGGGSIVNELDRRGMPSDFNSRKALAQNMGISNYRGTASQNQQLLAAVRGGQASTAGIGVQGADATNVDQPQVSQGRMSNAEMREIAQLAGRAGLSVSEYQSLIEGGNLPTAEESEAVRQELGIPGLIDDAYKKPQKQTVEIYRELYNDLGLNDLKENIREVNDRLSKKRDDLVEATGALKNNPWLSQGSRTGRLRVLNELALTDIQNDLDEKQQLLDLYDQGVDEIESQIGFITADQQLERDLTVDKLNFLLTEAEREESLIERRNTTRGLRNIPDFLRGVDQFNVASEVTGGGGSGSGFGVTGTGDPSTLSARARAVYENPSLIENYTATNKGEILDELAAKGFNLEQFTQENLSGTQRDQLASFDDLIRQGQELEIILEETGLNVGPIASRFEAAQAFTGIGDSEDFTDYRSVIDNMGSALLKLRSGAAVTPQEFERLRGFIPDKNDPDDVAANKINNFYTELEKARKNFVKRATQSKEQIQRSVGIGAGGSTAEPTQEDQDYVKSLGY